MLLLLPGQAPGENTIHRELFLRAEKALHQKDRDTYAELLPKLQDYPLQPYLIYQDLLQRMSLDSAQEIRSFLDAHQGTPLGSQLRNKWLHYLADKQQWAMFLQHCQEQCSGELACVRARALLHTGKHQASLELARNLWLYPYSRPDSCDFVFEHWQQENGLDVKHFWQRVKLAINAGNRSLVQHLQSGLSSEKKELARIWLKIDQKPELALELDWSEVPTQIKGEALLTGLKKLVRQDVEQAARDWDDLKQQYNWTAADFPQIERDIALFLALRNKPGAFSRLGQLPPQAQDSKTRTWQVRAALMQQDWQLVLQALQRLESLEQELRPWLYWRARALEKLGQDQEARGIYQDLAQGQDYYALLAADKLDLSYDFKHQSAEADMDVLLEIWQNPGLQRAVELYHLQRLPEARREWRQALSGSNAKQYKAAAILARDLGWPDQAIFAAASVPGFQDLEIRCPLSYQKQTLEQTMSQGLNPAWVLAVMRQESAFMLDARSSAGALGLMQIMPATGQAIAGELDERFSHPFQLLHPETNIRYGIFYLRQQLEKFQGNLVLASAAYNAGRSNVLRWLSRRNTLPADIWVECIPYAETRKYVQKILYYTVIYESRLGRTPSRISSKMPDTIGDGHALAEKGQDKKAD